MKKLKKLALWLMMMVLVFSLSACGEKEDDDSKSDRKDRVEESNDKDDEDSKDDADDKDSKDDEEESKSKEEDGETKAKDEDEADASKEKEEEPETDEVDAEFLLNKLYEIANNNNTMTQVTTNMEIEMSMSMSGVTIDLDMVSSGKNLIQLNPYTAYTYMEMTMEMMGQQETMVTENYILTEDGNLVSYAYDGSVDYWTKMDIGMSEAELMEQTETNFDWIKEKPVSDFTVDTQLHNIGGRDAYKVEFTLTGQEMNQSLNGMAGVKDMLDESGLGDFDMSSLNVPAVYYIDAETYQIIQMEMNIEGMGEMMNDMMSSLLGADAETAGYQMDINIGKCYMIYSDISYEPVEIPALPAEATETTDVINIEDLDISDTDTTQVQPEDGVYTIEESGAVAKVTCPEGWTVLYSAYDSINIENEETWQEAEFVMYMDVTREDFVAYVEEMVVPELQQYEGVYVSHGAGPQIGDYETMEVLGDGLNFYFAWAPAGEGWIMVTVSEFNGVSLEEALPPILDLIDVSNVL